MHVVYISRFSNFHLYINKAISKSLTKNVLTLITDSINLLTWAVVSYPNPGDIDDSSYPTPPKS